MRKLRLLFAALFATAALLSTGCPTLNLSQVQILPGSVSRSGLTLQATVVVEETDATTGEGNTPAEGKGVIGVHLPVGWSVARGRVQVPGEPMQRALYAAPQAAVAMAQSFPQTPGQWWAFASNSQTIQQGQHTYSVELDLVPPKKAKETLLGVTATVLTDDLTEIPAPLQYKLLLKGKKSKLVPHQAAPAMPEPAPEAETSPKVSS